MNSQVKDQTVDVVFLDPGQLFVFFRTQMQECIYLLLVFIDCLPYAKHDAKPYEKYKTVGSTSTLKEPILQ